MPEQPIVVGVDDSDAATRATTIATALAAAAGTSCQLVHAVRSPWASSPKPAGQTEALDHAALAAARTRVTKALAPTVSPSLLDKMMVRLGRSTVELNDVADRLNAQLIVIGGKRHSTFGRWFGSSTGHGLARTADRPVLVTGSSAEPLRRILVAADFSDESRPVLATAQRYARALGAALRVVTVVEPLPITPEVPLTVDPDEYYRWAEAELASDIWPLVTHPGADKVVRIGYPVEAILRELTDWAADLVVLGSHGRNAVERALLGSVSEHLLNQLPAALLLVPPSRRAEAHVPQTVLQPAGAA